MRHIQTPDALQHMFVWDIGIRLFHWTLAILFIANDLLISDDSEWHQWIGYAIGCLLLLRVIWGFFGTRYARFSSFRPSLDGAYEQLNEIICTDRKTHIGHSPLGALMIYNLLLSIALAILFGHLTTTDFFWGNDLFEELHEGIVTWIELSVILHIAAVLFESRRTQVQLIKAMLTGKKNIRSDN